MDLKSLMRTNRPGNAELVKQRIEGGENPYHVTDNSSPFLVACLNGHLDLIKLVLKMKKPPQFLDHSLLVNIVSSESLDYTKIVQVIKVLLNNSAVQVHPDDPYSESAMVIACKKGYTRLVTCLLPYDNWDNSGYVKKVLKTTIDNDRIEVLELLFESGRINPDRTMITYLLHYACRPTEVGPPSHWIQSMKPLEHRSEIVELLLARDAGSVDCVCEMYSDGWSPLMRASAGGHNKTVQVLLEKGANIDFQIEREGEHDRRKVEGNTALMIAVVTGKTETVKLLLEKGASIDLVNKQDKTALLTGTEVFTVENNKGFNKPQSNVEIIQALLKKGANVNILDCNGMSALVNAIRNRSAEAVELLLLHGAQTDTGTDYNKNPPLNLAIKESAYKVEIQLKKIRPCNNKVPKLLLESGAPVNLQNEGDGESPLMIACSTRNAEMCRLLLDKGADVDLCDREGKDALLYAVKAAELYLQQESLFPGLLHPQGALKENLETIEMLLGKGANFKSGADNGDSAFSILKKIGTSLWQRTTTEGETKFPIFHKTLKSIDALKNGDAISDEQLQAMNQIANIERQVVLTHVARLCDPAVAALYYHKLGGLTAGSHPPPLTMELEPPVQPPSTVSTGRLQNSDLVWMCEKLGQYAYKWKEIALGLGFTSPELSNIEAAPLLLIGAPHSYLRAVLSSWLQWAPRDVRGSTDYATLQALKSAVDRADLGRLAQELQRPK